MKLSKYAFLGFIISLPIIFASCSTGNNYPIIIGEIASCEITGELAHTQYWNDKDFWDLKSLSILIKYKNDDEIVFAATGNDFIVYSFFPETPVGLNPGEVSLTVGGYFLDSTNEKHIIKNRVFDNIKIIDYPYRDNEVSEKNKIITFTLVGAILIVGLIAIFVALVRQKKKE